MPQQGQTDLLPLPDDKNPAFNCMYLDIPDDPQYRQLLIGKIRELCKWDNYDRTGDTQGAQVAKVWKRVLDSLSFECSECTDPEAQCISFYPTSSPDRFEWSPGVVNGGTDAPPAGYAENPFFTGDNYVIPGFQLFSSDIIGDGNSFRPVSVGGIFEQILLSGLPRMRFHWTGAATLEIHMLKVPFGGFVIARIDDGVEVNIYDIAGIALADIAPSVEAILGFIEGIGEADWIPVEIAEIVVDGAGDHHLDILFCPELQLSITPIRWGGGIRKIVVCGKDIDCEDQKCREDDCGCGDCGQDCDDCGCE